MNINYEAMTTTLQDKKQCRRTYSVIALTLTAAYAAAYIAAGLLGRWLADLYHSGSLPLPGSTVTAIVSFAPMYLICFPIIFIVMSRLKSDKPKESRLGAKDFFISLSACFPIMFAGSIIGNLLSYLLSEGQSQNNLAELLGNLDPVVIIISTFVAPVIEELVFRKTIIDKTKKYGELAAIVFSAVCFGLFHMNLYQFFYAAGVGLLFGYIYVRTGKVIYTIIMHIVVNSLSSIIVPFLLAKSNYLEIVSKLGEQELESLLAPDRMVWIALYMMYTMLYFAAICFGFAMIITNRKKIRLEESTCGLTRGDSMKAAFINIGMAVYLIAAVFFFIIALFGIILF